jgi:zinc protease
VTQGVTAQELLRAKNLFASSFWNQLATIDGKASLLGSFEVFEGNYQKLFDAPAVYEKVTREDVQKAASQLLQKRHRTVGVLNSPPGETAPPAPTPAEAKP